MEMRIILTALVLSVVACEKTTTTGEHIGSLRNIEQLMAESRKPGTGEGEDYSGTYKVVYTNLNATQGLITAKKTHEDTLTCDQTSDELECTSASTKGRMRGHVNKNGKFVIAENVPDEGFKYYEWNKPGALQIYTEVLKGTFSSNDKGDGIYYFVASSKSEKNVLNARVDAHFKLTRIKGTQSASAIDEDVSEDPLDEED